LRLSSPSEETIPNNPKRIASNIFRINRVR
jgi:hypothetical protein